MSFWTVGIQDPETGGVELLGESVTFPQGMRILLDRAESDNTDEVLFADLNDIVHDTGIMDDEDQWEEEDFYAKDGKIWYIVSDDHIRGIEAILDL